MTRVMILAAIVLLSSRLLGYAIDQVFDISWEISRTSPAMAEPR